MRVKGCLSISSFQKEKNDKYSVKQGIHTEGKAEYDLPPCSNQFRLAAFNTVNIFFLILFKQANFKRRLTVLSLPLQYGFHGCNRKVLAYRD
jgi:hypothetical protein